MSSRCCSPNCDKDGSQLCGKCLVVRYCSRKHQVDHWKDHKLRCFPIKLDKNKELGRYLIASKDIKAGDLIISERPLTAGPVVHSNPLCLGCLRPVDGKYLCPKCGWPICCAICPAFSNHSRECSIFGPTGIKPNIKTFDEFHPMYEVITPLRCLWMKIHDPPRWSKFCELQSNFNERKVQQVDGRSQQYVLHMVRNFYKLNQFSDDDVKLVCGILETNGFEIPGDKIVAVYLEASMIEHCCVSNTVTLFTNAYEIKIQAAVDIKKDEHITLSYCNPMIGARMRRVNLTAIKYFICNCFRCKDPSDLGVHFSSIKCDFCREGIAIPPFDHADDYECMRCGKKTSSVEVEEYTTKRARNLEELPIQVAPLEKYLKETRKYYTENYHLRVNAKLILFDLLGNGCGNTLKELLPDVLEKKLDLGEELDTIASKYVPGLSRLRVHLLQGLGEAYLERYHRLIKRLRHGKEGMIILTHVEEMFDVVSKHHKMGSDDSISISTVETMKKHLEDIKTLKQLCNLETTS